jgi:hypothetical protein
MLRRRLTIAELAVVVGLLYFMVTVPLGAMILGTAGLSGRVVAPDGWYSLLAYAAAAACTLRTWRHHRQDVAGPAPRPLPCSRDERRRY